MRVASSCNNLLSWNPTSWWSRRTSLLTRLGYISAYPNAIAPPFEWPSKTGYRSRCRCWRRSSFVMLVVLMIHPFHENGRIWQYNRWYLGYWCGLQVSITLAVHFQDIEILSPSQGVEQQLHCVDLRFRWMDDARHIQISNLFLEHWRRGFLSWVLPTFGKMWEVESISESYARYICNRIVTSFGIVLLCCKSRSILMKNRICT